MIGIESGGTPFASFSSSHYDDGRNADAEEQQKNRRASAATDNDVTASMTLMICGNGRRISTINGHDLFIGFAPKSDLRNGES